MEFWIDTNIIIRFLANDHPEHSMAAKKMFLDAFNGKYTFWIHPLVIAECCYVLEGKHYGYDRVTIATSLTSLLNTKGIKTVESQSLFNALDWYAKVSVDFEDAFLAMKVKEYSSRAVLSFNHKDFQKCECECYNPMMME